MAARLVSIIERKSDRFLYLLVALLLILGAAYAVYLGNSIRFYPDECDYIDLAHNLVTTGLYTLDGKQPTAYRPPGYPVYLAAVAFSGENYVFSRLLNFIALAVVVCCVYKILKEQSTPLAACIGALLVVGYPLAFYTAGTLYPQTLAAALFLLTLYFFTRRAMKSLDYFLSGLFLGCLILTAPNFIFVLVVYAGWRLLVPPRRPSKDWMIGLIPVLVLFGGWTVRNYLVFNTFFFVSTNSGEMLLIGNSENTTPNAGRTADITKYRTEAQPLSEIERDRYYQTQALEFMRTHIAHTVRLYFLKVLNYFNYRNDLKTKYEASNIKDLVLLLTYGPLLLLSILRLVLFKLYKLSKFEILLVSLYLSNAFLSAIFVTRIRYRLPFDFLLILLAALFLEQLIRGKHLKLVYEDTHMYKKFFIGILLVTLIGQLAGCRPRPTPELTSPALADSTPTLPLSGSPTPITASPSLLATKRSGTPLSVPNSTTLTVATPVLLPTQRPGTLPPVPDSTTLANATPTLVLVPTQTAALIPSPSPAPLDRPIQGMTLFDIGSTQELSLLSMAGGYWTRFDRIHWDAIEPLNQDPPDYHWETVDEASLIKASASGAGIIALIMYAPYWAQKYPGIACGPFSEESFDEFARFMHAVVSRYSQPPYRVKYWEIGNEPDIDPTLVSPQSGFGCWGEKNDEYYGGGYYAEMLKVVYPQIKAADPDAQVLVGGLLLDCDPVNPPETSPGSGTKKDCSSARFIEGILRNGGGDFFDAISFHAYDYYFGGWGHYGNQGWNCAWNTTGPAIAHKADYLRGLLALYGHPEKILMNTEVAILCGSSGEESTCQTDVFARTKANYLAEVNATAQADGIWTDIWYSLLGWRASGLINSNWDPLLAYHAYQASVVRLSKAVFSKDLTAFPQVKGYEFAREGTVLWVLWSLDGEPHRVQLPSQPTAIYDVLGQPLAQEQSLTITLDPVYIEWSP